MAATARLIVMTEEREKAALDAAAEAARVSTAEFVRRRLFAQREPEEQAFFETLAALRPLVRNACRTIERNLADIRTLRESRDKRDAQVVERVRRELTRDELTSIAGRLRLTPISPDTRRRRRGTYVSLLQDARDKFRRNRRQSEGPFSRDQDTPRSAIGWVPLM